MLRAEGGYSMDVTEEL